MEAGFGSHKLCFKSSKPTGSSTDQTRQDGAAHRAPRPKPDILSLSLSHITAATLVVVHTQLHGPKKRSIGTLKNAKIPRPKNQPCALPTWLRARECARGKRGVANGREVAATEFFVSCGHLQKLSVAKTKTETRKAYYKRGSTTDNSNHLHVLSVSGTLLRLNSQCGSFPLPPRIHPPHRTAPHSHLTPRQTHTVEYTCPSFIDTF